MVLPIYSYRDSKVGFGSPIVEHNEQTAVRGFSYAVNSNDGLMNFSPKDYDLYKIGEFDIEKGVIVPELVPILICTGTSVITD